MIFNSELPPSLSLTYSILSYQQCGHGWTSMKGRVAFWFDLTFASGLLAFKLYGQTCEKCKNPERLVCFFFKFFT